MLTNRESTSPPSQFVIAIVSGRWQAHANRPELNERFILFGVSIQNDSIYLNSTCETALGKNCSCFSLSHSTRVCCCGAGKLEKKEKKMMKSEAKWMDLVVVVDVIIRATQERNKNNPPSTSNREWFFFYIFFIFSGDRLPTFISQSRNTPCYFLFQIILFLFVVVVVVVFSLEKYKMNRSLKGHTTPYTSTHSLSRNKYKLQRCGRQRRMVKRKRKVLFLYIFSSSSTHISRPEK